VTALRVTAGAVALAALVTPAAAAWQLRPGNPRAQALARSGPARDGLTQLRAAGLPAGLLSPLEVLVRAGGHPERVAAAAAGVPGVWTAIAPRAPGWRDGTGSLVAVVPRDEPMTDPGRRTVASVRDAVARIPAEGGVRPRTGGSGVSDVDLEDGLYRSAPWLLGLAAAVAAAVMRLLGVSARLALGAAARTAVVAAAACGALVLVWQDGLGSPVDGVPATGAVTGWVPLVVGVFALAVGLERAPARSPRRPGQALGVMSAAACAFALLAAGLGPQVELAVLASGFAAALLLAVVPPILPGGTVLGARPRSEPALLRRTDARLEAAAGAEAGHQVRVDAPDGAQRQTEPAGRDVVGAADAQQQ
jgi:RND superfamily putative drug exporter